MSEAVWDAPQTEHKAAKPIKSGGAQLPAEPLSAMDVPKRVWSDLQANPMGYAGSGFGYMGVALGVIGVSLGALAIGVLPGAIGENETMLIVGGILGFIVYFAAIMSFTFLAYPLMFASSIRAINRQMDGGEPAGVGSLFSTVTTDAKNIVGLHLLSQLLVLIGMLLLYLPGFVAVMVCGMAMTIHVLEPEVSITDALARAFAHFKENPGWHVSVWLLMLPAFVALELTIVGLVLIYPVMVAWQVSAYRLAFPNGSSPVQ